MATQLKIDNVSIVIVGEFSPTVFHPSWLKAHNLLAAAEADGAKTELVHPDVTVLTTDWLVLNVRKDRFTASCIRGESAVMFRDFVTGILQLFPNIPVQAIGLNKEMHFQMESEAEWHALGHKLAPKEPWATLLTNPGMLTVQMQGKRSDAYQGSINVVVQPSAKLQFGTFVQVNDHYNLVKDKSPGSGSDALAILKTEWKLSLERSESIGQTIVK